MVRIYKTLLISMISIASALLPRNELPVQQNEVLTLPLYMTMKEINTRHTLNITILSDKATTREQIKECKVNVNALKTGRILWNARTSEAQNSTYIRVFDMDDYLSYRSNPDNTLKILSYDVVLDHDTDVNAHLYNQELIWAPHKSAHFAKRGDYFCRINKSPNTPHDRVQQITREEYLNIRAQQNSITHYPCPEDFTAYDLTNVSFDPFHFSSLSL